ncbi:putative aminotransferase ACS12 [Platanthera guangdongensis]|uniref:Aminotransferase ACS12 n=1 Tax=Platanthera guangdongensis TaxID=2320717 RepID=A0ABR2LPI1_9ASPA
MSPSPSPSLSRIPFGAGGDDREVHDDTSSSRSDLGVGGGTAMRLVVPLQGVVQGRGGLVLGSVIPCALFYFFQLYLRRKKPSSSPPTSPFPSSGDLPSLSVIPRTTSRSFFSPRSGSLPAPVSSHTAAANKSDACPLSAGHRRFVDDPYHPTSNPDGVIQLGLGNNQLLLDLVRDWLERNVNASLLKGRNEDMGLGGMETYLQYDGLMDLKIAVADFMGQVLQGSVSFSPSQMVLTAGAASAIETLCFCLADPGQAILVPSPYDSEYEMNIKWRTSVDVIAVPCRSTDSFNISVAAIERAYNQAKKRGVKVRAILFSNPSNPVGNLLKRETLYDLLEFITEKNIHLIFDELLVGSVHEENNTCMNIAKILDAEDFDKSRVHMIYRLSEDLSLPHIHVGVIYSLNDSILASAAKFARFSSISVLSQRVLVTMLSDKRFILEFLHLSRARLINMHRLFARGFKDLNIDCVNGDGGFRCWVDLSKFLRSYSVKGELEMWEKLLDSAKVNMMPGSSCRCIEPGWFRLCFAALSENDVDVVMGRIRRAIDEGHKI